MGRLEGKRAVITGATGGIGATVAKRFLDEGAQVLIAARSADKLEALQDSLNSERLHALATDVAREADVARLAATTGERLGGIDIVFANAGTEGSIKPLLLMEQAEFDQVQQTNVRGTWLTIKHCVPHMGRGASIVITSSVAGEIGVPGLASYCASKHALLGLTKVAALELAESGIRVNAVAPAPVDNAMMRPIEEQAAPGAADQARAGFEALTAMKRYASNEEVAAMVTFLASDESSFCTGACYPVDGGLLAQ